MSPTQSPGRSASGAVSGNLNATSSIGAPLSYSLAQDPAGGTVTLGQDGAYTYTPNAALASTGGTDSFRVTVAEDTTAYRLTGIGGAIQGILSALATAFGMRQPDTVTVTVPVSVVGNAAPVAGTPVVGTPDPVTGIVLGQVNATDPDGNPLTFSGPGTTLRGSVIIDSSTGAFTYTPSLAGRNASATGVATADTFTVTVSNPLGVIATVPVSVALLPSRSYVSFDLVYDEGSEYWSTDGRNYLQSAANYLASHFVVQSSVTISVVVRGRNEPDQNYLAMGGPLGYGRFTSGWELLSQTKILTGIDDNGSGPDAQLIWNFGHGWSGVESQKYGYTYQTVAIHELLHCIGFLSTIDPSGEFWTVWDTFMTAPDGNRIIGNGIPWTGTYVPNLSGENGGLYFGGPNAVAAWGGLIPMSGAHLTDPQNPRHVWGGIPVIYSVELGVLTDLGYTVVPQPPLYAVVVVGFGLLRRRRPRARPNIWLRSAATPDSRWHDRLGDHADPDARRGNRRGTRGHPGGTGPADSDGHSRPRLGPDGYATQGRYDVAISCI